LAWPELKAFEKWELAFHHVAITQIPPRYRAKAPASKKGLANETKISNIYIIDFSLCTHLPTLWCVGSCVAVD